MQPVSEVPPDSAARTSALENHQTPIRPPPSQEGPLPPRVPSLMDRRGLYCAVNGRFRVSGPDGPCVQPSARLRLARCRRSPLGCPGWPPPPPPPAPAFLHPELHIAPLFRSAVPSCRAARRVGVPPPAQRPLPRWRWSRLGGPTDTPRRIDRRTEACLTCWSREPSRPRGGASPGFRGPAAHIPRRAAGPQPPAGRHSTPFGKSPFRSFGAPPTDGSLAHQRGLTWDWGTPRGPLGRAKRLKRATGARGGHHREGAGGGDRPNRLLGTAWPTNRPDGRYPAARADWTPRRPRRPQALASDIPGVRAGGRAGGPPRGAMGRGGGSPGEARAGNDPGRAPFGACIGAPCEGFEPERLAQGREGGPIAGAQTALARRVTRCAGSRYS